jgi:hypothetical protein
MGFPGSLSVVEDLDRKYEMFVRISKSDSESKPKAKKPAK